MASISTISNTEDNLNRVRSIAKILEILLSLGVKNVRAGYGCEIIPELITKEELQILDKHFRREFWNGYVDWIVDEQFVPGTTQHRRTVRLYSSEKKVNVTGEELYVEIMSSPNGKV